MLVYGYESSFVLPCMVIPKRRPRDSQAAGAEFHAMGEHPSGQKRTDAGLDLLAWVALQRFFSSKTEMSWARGNFGVWLLQIRESRQSGGPAGKASASGLVARHTLHGGKT